jgi:hypothetical protein
VVEALGTAPCALFPLRFLGPKAQGARLGQETLAVVRYGDEVRQALRGACVFPKGLCAVHRVHNRRQPASVRARVK